MWGTFCLLLGKCLSDFVYFLLNIFSFIDCIFVYFIKNVWFIKYLCIFLFAIFFLQNYGYKINFALKIFLLAYLSYRLAYLPHILVRYTHWWQLQNKNKRHVILKLPESTKNCKELHVSNELSFSIRRNRDMLCLWKPKQYWKGMEEKRIFISMQPTVQLTTSYLLLFTLCSLSVGHLIFR